MRLSKRTIASRANGAQSHGSPMNAIRHSLQLACVEEMAAATWRRMAIETSLLLRAYEQPTNLETVCARPPPGNTMRQRVATASVPMVIWLPIAWAARCCPCYEQFDDQARIPPECRSHFSGDVGARCVLTSLNFESRIISRSHRLRTTSRQLSPSRRILTTFLTCDPHTGLTGTQ
jgi:hypothetical protein